MIAYTHTGGKNNWDKPIDIFQSPKRLFTNIHRFESLVTMQRSLMTVVSVYSVLRQLNLECRRFFV